MRYGFTNQVTFVRLMQYSTHIEPNFLLYTLGIFASNSSKNIPPSQILFKAFKYSIKINE